MLCLAKFRMSSQRPPSLGIPLAPRSLTVSPSSHTFTEIGQELQLSVTARGADGQTIDDPGVTWTSRNDEVATVDTQGNVIARGIGTTFIVASAVCCMADSAALTGPRADGEFWRANEPPGFVTLTDNPMVADPYANMHVDWGGPLDREGWIELVVPDVPPPSPASEAVFQFVYPLGHPSGHDASRVWFSLPSGVREFYVSYTFRPDPDWHVLSNDNGTKVLHFWMGDQGVFVGYLLNQDGAVLQVNGTPAFDLLGNQGVGRSHNILQPGEWSTIEIHLRINDSGQSNGVARWWVDGQVLGNYTGLTFPSSSENRFTQFVISGTWGGGVPNKTKEEWLQYGQVYLSRAP
jgi:hypothetical protein